MTTYYDILGVDETATQSDIKRAYRKLAKELHPDQNPDHNDDRMKDINAAYDTLKNEVKRQKYDASLRSPQNMYGDFPNASHLQTTIGVPIDIMINGGKISAPVRIPTDMSMSPFGMIGFGYTTKMVDVEILPETPVGHGITLSPDEHGLDGVGQLVIQIMPAPPDSDKYKLAGYDIHYRMSLSAIDALLGTRADIDLPTGESIRLTIPEKTQGGQVIRVPNKGLFMQGNNRGDVFVVVSLTLPDVTDSQLETLKGIFR